MSGRFWIPEHAALHGLTAVVLQAVLRDGDVRQLIGRELDRLPEPAARLVLDNLRTIDHAAEVHRGNVAEAVSMREGNPGVETGPAVAQSGDNPMTARQVGAVLDLSPKRVKQLASELEWFGSQDSPPRGPWTFTRQQVVQMREMREGVT